MMSPDAALAVAARVSAAVEAWSAPMPNWSIMSPRYFALSAALTCAADARTREAWVLLMAWSVRKPALASSTMASAASEAVAPGSFRSLPSWLAVAEARCICIAVAPVTAPKVFIA